MALRAQARMVRTTLRFILSKRKEKINSPAEPLYSTASILLQFLAHIKRARSSYVTIFKKVGQICFPGGLTLWQVDESYWKLEANVLKHGGKMVDFEGFKDQEKTQHKLNKLHCVILLKYRLATLSCILPGFLSCVYVSVFWVDIYLWKCMRADTGPNGGRGDRL